MSKALVCSSTSPPLQPGSFTGDLCRCHQAHLFLEEALHNQQDIRSLWKGTIRDTNGPPALEIGIRRKPMAPTGKHLLRLADQHLDVQFLWTSACWLACWKSACRAVAQEWPRLPFTFGQCYGLFVVWLTVCVRVSKTCCSHSKSLP